MTSRLRHKLATGQDPLSRGVRSLHRGARGFSIPWPRAITVPYRVGYVAVRSLIHWLRRTFVAGPIFRSYCARVGRNFRTDIYVHWVQGSGRIEVGDDVLIDGKCSFTFTNRYAEKPALRIGDRCYVGHDCTFVVAGAVTIGSDVRIAEGVTLRESPGHPLDPVARARGDAAEPASVQPIQIDDGAWIGADATILPGVSIGAGAVVATCSVVTRSVPPGAVVAGNPARIVREAIGLP